MEYYSLHCMIMWQKLKMLAPNNDYTKFDKVILKNYDYIYGIYNVKSELRNIKNHREKHCNQTYNDTIEQFFCGLIHDHALIIALNDKKLTNCWITNDNDLVLLFTRPPIKTNTIYLGWDC